jgi:hypothetical protein
MLAKNGAGPNLCDDRGGTGKVVKHFGKCTTFKAPQPNFQEAIQAELTGSDTATAAGLMVRTHAPLLALCRKLIEAGHDPDRPLEAWRDGTLALTVRTIGEAADLRINSKGTGFIAPNVVRTGPLCLNGNGHV